MSEQTTTIVQDPSVTTTAPVETPKVVPYEDHQRALSDMHKYKQKNSQLEKEAKERSEKEMRDTQQWQKLAEAKALEATTAIERANKIESSFINNQKYSALKDECTRLGLRSEAVSDLELLDLDGIQIETTSTGKLNVLGAKTFAEKVKALKPHWFGQTQVNVNTNNPRVVDPTGPVSPKDIYTAEQNYRKSGKAEDYQAYQEMHLKFRKQGRG